MISGIFNHQVTNIAPSIVSILELKLSKFLLADEISTVFMVYPSKIIKVKS